MKKVTVYDYYKDFIEEADIEIAKATKTISDCTFDNINLKMLLESASDNIETKFKIVLSDYEEYTDLIYNADKPLFNAAHKEYLKAGKNIDSKDKINLIFIIRFAKNIERINVANDKIRILQGRKNIPCRQFEAYIKRYYLEVQKKVLNGDCYKYSNGIGVFFINRVKNIKGNHYQGRLDYNKTRLNKERIIAEGGIPYCKEDAIDHEKRGIPYNGVKYIEYLREDHLYEFCLINAVLPKGLHVKFERTDYRGASIRNISDDEIPYMINSIDDIYNIDGDLRVKLVQMLKFDPSIYVKYIRNKNENKINLW